MDDPDKTKVQLVTELAQLRQRIAELAVTETEHNQVKEALQTSETQYRRLFEAAQDGILILDAATGEITAVNPFLTNLLGYAQKEILGQKLWEIGPFKNTKASKIAFKELQHKEYIRYEDLPLETGDGRSIAVEFVSNVYLVDHKKVIQCNIRDITERKQAEMALQESEARYRAITCSANDAIITADSAGNIVGWNRGAERIFGYTEAEVNGQPLTVLLPPQYRDPHLMGLQRVQSGGEPYLIGKTAELAGRRQDGDEFPLELSLAQWEIAGSRFYTGIIRDITKRKQAATALRTSEQKLMTLFEILPVGISVLDSERRTVYINPAMERILDITAASLFNGDYQSRTYLRPDGTPMPAEEFASARALREQREVRDVEIGVVKEDGRVIWTNVSAVPVEFPDWKVVVVTSDITGRKQLEAENLQLTEQFYQTQKTESIGRLAGGIAHDFNNLLVPIIGYTELGMLKLAPDSQLYTDLKRIKAAGERAAELTRQILAFSRQQVLDMKMLDLNLVIREFEPLLQRLIREDIDLQIRLAAKLPPIKADKGQLEQVVLNLVVNARDAMPEGGTLLIETAGVVLDKAYVGKHLGTQRGPQILLAVTDTGHGMDAATQQRIFEPFFTTKMQGQGTGLGLATVFGVIKQHQGNIWVYSEPGRGTTFKIYLPVTDTSISTEAAADLDTDFLGTETIMVVEDEAGVRLLVADMLRTHGYHVLAAEDPLAGLELAKTYEGHIDLLLTDVIMPHMSGGELYRQLVLGQPDLKVLYMSGYTDNVILHHGVSAQEGVFLEKPFSITSLLQKVRTVLG